MASQCLGLIVSLLPAMRSLLMVGLPPDQHVLLDDFAAVTRVRWEEECRARAPVHGARLRPSTGLRVVPRHPTARVCVQDYNTHIDRILNKFVGLIRDGAAARLRGIEVCGAVLAVACRAHTVRPGLTRWPPVQNIRWDEPGPTPSRAAEDLIKDVSMLHKVLQPRLRPAQTTVRCGRAEHPSAYDRHVVYAGWVRIPGGVLKSGCDAG